jgi:signal transduction histidine kinase/CheY-like chemotaxis protein
MKVRLFNYITSPNSANKKTAYDFSVDLEESAKALGGGQYLQLFRLHSVFILDNYEKSQVYRKEFMAMPVIDEILNSISVLRNNIESAQYLRYLSGFCSLLSLLLIFIFILKKQQYAIRKTSNAYRHAADVKTQFLANMSHEIRTPITGIVGLLDLCLKTPLNNEQKNYLNKVKFSANSLLTIISDILDLSRIDAGKLAIENIPFDHDKLIDGLIMMIGNVAEEKNIELIFDLDPEIPPTLIGDPVRLAQVLLNMLANAVKFTSAGHIIFRSTLIAGKFTGENQYTSGDEGTANYSADENTFAIEKQSHRLGDTIRYQIEDTGIGLSPEQQAKLFKRFSQADESTTRKYGGTGLGLAVSKLLVDAMLGDIQIVSQAGKGSTFSVTLPLITDNNPLSIPLAEKIPSDERYKGLRILLLEDNKVTQSIVSKMACYCEVALDISSEISEATLLCQRNQYDIALIDWSLQQETGLDFLSAISETSYSPHFSVIFSAYSQSYIKEKSISGFSCHYLAKPLTLASFTQQLDLYLDPKKWSVADTRVENEKLTSATVDSLIAVSEKALIASPLQQGVQQGMQQDLLASSRQDSEKDSRPDRGCTPHKNTLAPQKILLVEDNVINQLIATKLLENLGLDVDVAEDGYAALDIIAENDYPVVLMDIQMPKLDGVATTIELRKKYSKEQLNIVALTANVSAEEVEYYKSVGMNGYLGKPYDVDKIRELLMNYYRCAEEA